MKSKATHLTKLSVHPLGAALLHCRLLLGRGDLGVEDDGLALGGHGEHAAGEGGGAAHAAHGVHACRKV